MSNALTREAAMDAARSMYEAALNQWIEKINEQIEQNIDAQGCVRVYLKAQKLYNTDKMLKDVRRAFLVAGWERVSIQFNETTGDVTIEMQ